MLRKLNWTGNSRQSFLCFIPVLLSEQAAFSTKWVTTVLAGTNKLWVTYPLQRDWVLADLWHFWIPLYNVKKNLHFLIISCNDRIQKEEYMLKSVLVQQCQRVVFCLSVTSSLISWHGEVKILPHVSSPATLAACATLALLLVLNKGEECKGWWERMGQSWLKLKKTQLHFKTDDTITPLMTTNENSWSRIRVWTTSDPCVKSKKYY